MTNIYISHSFGKELLAIKVKVKVFSIWSDALLQNLF